MANVVLHWVSLHGISMLPATEINFSNEIESAIMVAKKAKSCYSYLRPVIGDNHY